MSEFDYSTGGFDISEEEHNVICNRIVIEAKRQARIEELENMVAWYDKKENWYKSFHDYKKERLKELKEKVGLMTNKIIKTTVFKVKKYCLTKNANELIEIGKLEGAKQERKRIIKILENEVKNASLDWSLQYNGKVQIGYLQAIETIKMVD